MKIYSSALTCRPVFRYDLAEAVQCALKRPDICYDTFYPATGPQSERFFDLEHIRNELGWYPQHTFKELAGLPLRRGNGG